MTLPLERTASIAPVYVAQYPETVASLMGIRTAFAPSFDTNWVMTLVPVARAEL